MGRGSKPTESNVIKRPKTYSDNAGAIGAGGGPAAEKRTMDKCLISFSTKIRFTADYEDVVRTGAQFALVLNGSGGLDVFIGARVVGSYSGSRASLLKECMSSGYLYRGQIGSVSDNHEAECVIKGYGPANATQAK